MQWCRVCQILWDILFDPQISCNIPTSWNISKQTNNDTSLAHHDSTQALSSLQWGWCSESQLWSCQLFQIFLITFPNIVGYSWYFQVAKKWYQATACPKGLAYVVMLECMLLQLTATEQIISNSSWKGRFCQKLQSNETYFFRWLVKSSFLSNIEGWHPKYSPWQWHLETWVDTLRHMTIVANRLWIGS